MERLISKLNLENLTQSCNALGAACMSASEQFNHDVSAVQQYAQQHGWIMAACQAAQGPAEIALIFLIPAAGAIFCNKYMVWKHGEHYFDQFNSIDEGYYPTDDEPCI